MHWRCVASLAHGFGPYTPDGVTTKITRSRAKTNRWMTHIKHVTPGYGEAEGLLDSFGRVVQSRLRGPDVDTADIPTFGKSLWIVQDTHYDFLERREWQSIARIDGGLIAEGKGSSWEYDNAGHNQFEYARGDFYAIELKRVAVI
jgi:hypothetical protein